jgi:molybdopterin-guanine dinucleotide biosynthesis protein A
MTGFVLAGGKSTRMGADKVFLEFRGKTLLEHALQTLREVTPEVMIVGNREKFASFGRVIEDVFEGQGPLGGIHAALTVCATELNLILAVDLPFMESAFLQYLAARAQSTDALVIVPRVEGRLQPLCAAYRREFRHEAGQSLSRGENRIDALFEKVQAMVISEEEIVRRGFSSAQFENLNTRAEFEQAQGRHF